MEYQTTGWLSPKLKQLEAENARLNNEVVKLREELAAAEGKSNAGGNRPLPAKGREMSKLLSEEKRRSLWLEFNVDYETIYAIEAAVLEAQSKQEPVAWTYTINNSHSVFSTEKPPEDAYDEGTLYPLYAAPVVQPGYKLLKDTTHDERSWPEDSSHENGAYFCMCHHCGRQFTGYKRRVTCKVCAAVIAAAEGRNA